MNSWDTQNTITMNDGLYGNPVICLKDTYVHAAQAKIERYEGTLDDSAFNSLNFKCRNPKIPDSSVDVMMNDMTLGDWEEWVLFPNKYACGAEVRSDTTTISNEKDATGLNGLTFKFCEYKYDTLEYKVASDGILGDWLNPLEAPAGYYTCGMKVKNQPSQDLKDDTALNAVNFIYCSIDDWNNQVNYNFNEGLYGDWGDNLMCPKNNYVYGVTVKVVPSKGSEDDTAMKDIALKCKPPFLGAKLPLYHSILALKVYGAIL